MYIRLNFGLIHVRFFVEATRPERDEVAECSRKPYHRFVH